MQTIFLITYLKEGNEKGNLKYLQNFNIEIEMPRKVVMAHFMVLSILC